MPPLSTIHFVSKWGEKNDIPVTIDIIDPWPDSFIKDVPKFLKPLGRMLITPYYLMLKNSFNRSKKVTAISNGYLKWASNYFSKDVKTACFYLAADLEEVRSFKEKNTKVLGAIKPKNELRLIYAGSLASSYDIPCILEAAELINQKHPGMTRFIITGLGPYKKLVEEYSHRLDNLEYLGWVSKEELLKQYCLADLGLIQHKNNLTQTVTYKLFNYISADMAVLNSLESEMMDLIEQNQMGLNNPPQRPKVLAENIEFFLAHPEKLMSFQRNATKFVEKEGDNTKVYKELIHFVTGE
jgi:glycosyltransferase involved in cell wall biosynthesis